MTLNEQFGRKPATKKGKPKQPYWDFERAKREWIQANPYCSSLQYEQAIRRLALLHGI